MKIDGLTRNTITKDYGSNAPTILGWIENANTGADLASHARDQIFSNNNPQQRADYLNYCITLCEREYGIERGKLRTGTQMENWLNNLTDPPANQQPETPRQAAARQNPENFASPGTATALPTSASPGEISKERTQVKGLS